MKVLLMRHGATRGNECGYYVGSRTDEPLSELGREQCSRAGIRSDVRKVYVSPLLRACETAHLCFPRAELVCVDGLVEFDFGVFEGRHPNDMEHDAAYRAWVDSGCRDRCPEGDCLEEYAGRAGRTAERILLAAYTLGEEEAIVVAHGGTIMATLSRLAADRGADFFGWHAPNCGGFAATARVVDGRIRLYDVRTCDTLIAYA